MAVDLRKPKHQIVDTRTRKVVGAWDFYADAAEHLDRLRNLRHNDFAISNLDFVYRANGVAYESFGFDPYSVQGIELRNDWGSTPLKAMTASAYMTDRTFGRK